MVGVASLLSSMVAVSWRSGIYEIVVGEKASSEATCTIVRGSCVSIVSATGSPYHREFGSSLGWFVNRRDDRRMTIVSLPCSDKGLEA